MNNSFELEKKVNESNMVRRSEKIILTEEEFAILSKCATDTVVRDNCLISEMPRIILRIYQGKFKGLIRAEVGFDSIEEAKQFIPLEWMKKEITGHSACKGCNSFRFK